MEEEKKVEEVPAKEEQPKKKRSIVGTIVNIILWLIVAFILINGVLGFVNFNKIQKEEEPIFMLSQDTYEQDGDTIEVYKFGLYKVVKQSDDTTYSYSIKPWFMDDVAKK